MKNGDCAAHTGCLSCANPPGSIFQFSHAETSLFHTDLTCRNPVQTGGGPGVQFLPCMVRGESESGHRSVVLELGGYLCSFAVGYITGFVGPAISKHSFKRTHVCIYKYICMHGREEMYDPVCWAQSFCHTDTNLDSFY